MEHTNFYTQRSKTPESIDIKLDRGDYVWDLTPQANFDISILKGAADIHRTVCIISGVTCLSFPVGLPTQGATVKSLSVRHDRVLMAAHARIWSLVTTALVRQLTSVTPAPLRTAATTTRVLTVVLVTALGYVDVHLATQVL